MISMIFLLAVCIWGLWGLYRSLFPRPSARTLQAVSKTADFTLAQRYKRLLDGAAGRLGRFIRIPDARRAEMARMLELQGEKTSPEQYTARILAKTLVPSSLCLLFSIRSPGLLALGLALPVFLVFAENSELKKGYLQRRETIEGDLPKMCSVVNSRLQSTANVAAILSTFLPIANPAMAAELSLTLVDMKTGSVEHALRRFEGRINSQKVSDVVRGLIAVNNGDDMRVFFQSKQYQFNNDYITVKKKAITARPMKLTMPGMLAFLFFFLILLYTQGYSIQQLVGEFF